MPNQPPLNPDALRAALTWFAEAVGEIEVKHADNGTRPGDYWNGYRAAKNEIADLLAEPKLIKKATEAALAVAQPVVNTVDRVSEVLRKHQWDQAFGQCICGKVMPTIVNSEHCVYVPDDKRMAEHQANVLHDPEVTL